MLKLAFLEKLLAVSSTFKTYDLHVEYDLIKN